MKGLKIALLVLLILLLLVMSAVLYLMLSGQMELLRGIVPDFMIPRPPLPSTETLPRPALEGGTPEQERLNRLYSQCWSVSPAGESVFEGDTARKPVTLTLLDAEALAGAGLREELIARLMDQVALAGRADEIYEENWQFRPELLRSCYESLLAERMAQPERFLIQRPVTLLYTFADGVWTLQNGDVLAPQQPDAEALYAAATAELPYLPLHYSIAEDALCGCVPDESKFVYTDDPAVISALLERPEAKALIGDQELVWNPDLPFVRDTLIRCYLDESILCIVWQEPEIGCLATFSEIFIADGSQLRRKISSDKPWSFWFEQTTSFARDTNAVLAFGGDFYYHGRDCGVSVYQREMIRFHPYNADTCFITADGDMRFLYMGTDISEEEMQQYLRDNDVVFSLAFGPVMIDEGVDVLPENYLWGEVNDFYARSALGLLGRHHYLTMNINCDPKRPELDHLPNLRDAADAMVKRGCWKAYTLDGGRTATTVFHYELINPVQYGKEIPISDIIYFASAVPGE